MTINEIAIVEQGSTVPLTGIKVVDKNVGSNNKGNIENLLMNMINLHTDLHL